MQMIQTACDEESIKSIGSMLVNPKLLLKSDDETDSESEMTKELSD